MTSSIVLPAGASDEEWHAARLRGVGGSDVAAACGISPWTSPYQLWLEKTGRVEPDFDDRAEERMRWGQLIEPLLLKEFDNRHPELILTGADGMYARDDAAWMRANVDGQAWTYQQDFAGVVECKTGNHRQVKHWDDDQVPVHYDAQAQWYMHVTGAPRAYIVALLDTSTYVERVRERDDELIASLVDLASEFWWHVQNDVPPPVTADDGTRDALSRVPADGSVVELDPSWRRDIARRADILEQIAALEEEQQYYDNALRAAMGSAEVATIDGEKVATHKAPSKPSRRCKWDALAADHPAIYAEYVTEKPAGRRLNYAKQKGIDE